MPFRNRILLIIAFCAISNQTQAFDGLLFKPKTADVIEPRIGAVTDFSDEKLRLDIGSSFDFLTIDKDVDSEMRAGADFFTFTRLRSEKNFKFPVETVDYYFGVNASYKKTLPEDLFRGDFSARLRIGHISAHLADGFAKDSIFLKTPFVYSREFADLSAAIENRFARLYIGATYVFSTTPSEMNAIVPQVGADSKINIWKSLFFTGGYDFKLLGKDGVYSGAHALQFGIMIETSENRGVALGGYFYDGLSVHGLFHSERDSYFGVGFQLIYY